MQIEALFRGENDYSLSPIFDSESVGTDQLDTPMNSESTNKVNEKTMKVSIYSPAGRAIRRLTAFVIVFVIGFRLLGAERKGASAELTKAVVGRSFVMRQAPNVAAKQYYRLGQKEFLCRHKLSGLFPNRQDVSDVSIIRVREDSETEVLNRTSKLDGNRMVSKEITKEYRFWVFTLKHPHLGKGEFRVTTSTGDEPVENVAEGRSSSPASSRCRWDSTQTQDRQASDRLAIPTKPRCREIRAGTSVGVLFR